MTQSIIKQVSYLRDNSSGLCSGVVDFGCAENLPTVKGLNHQGSSLIAHFEDNRDLNSLVIVGTSIVSSTSPMGA